MLHKTSHKRLRARKVKQDLPTQKMCHRTFSWLWELNTLGLEKGVEQWDLADKIMCPLNVLLIEREIRHGFHILFSHHHSVSTIKSTGMQMKYQWKKTPGCCCESGHNVDTLHKLRAGCGQSVPHMEVTSPWWQLKKHTFSSMALTPKLWYVYHWWWL